MLNSALKIIHVGVFIYRVQILIKYIKNILKKPLKIKTKKILICTVHPAHEPIRPAGHPARRAWARSPAANGRAAETARAARPLGLFLACLAGGRPQTVGSNPTAGRQSRSSKTGGASPQTLTGHFFSPSPFLTPQRVEATPTAAGARERWWRRHGSLAGA